MEYIDGRPLRGPVAPPEAVRLALGIAAALEAGHDRGITHRDLKPANVLVTQSGLKLLDFGLALVKDEAGRGLSDATTGADLGATVDSAGHGWLYVAGAGAGQTRRRALARMLKLPEK